MEVLILSTIFSICYTLYAIYIYIKSEMFPVKRFQDNEISIEKINFKSHLKRYIK